MMMLLMVVLPSLLTGGLAIREMPPESTGQQPGEASPIEEAAAEVEKTLAEVGDIDTNKTACSPLTFTLPHGYRPGAYLWAALSGNGVTVRPVVEPNCSVKSLRDGNCTSLLGKHLSGSGPGSVLGEMYVRKIGDLDASQHDRKTILLHWASMVRGQKDYPVTVELECEGRTQHTLPEDVDDVLMTFSCAALLPLLLVLACLGVFIMPCFFCRLCGACGGIGLAAVPPGPESPDHVATWLEQSWFIRATDWSWIRVGVVIVLASRLFLVSCMFPTSATLLNTVSWCISLCHLVLGLSVIWGLRSMRRVMLAYCTDDLQMSLRGEFRLIACVLAPKMFLAFVISTGGLPILCILFISHQVYGYGDAGLVQGLAFLGCESLIFIMMTRFLLEAAIAGRIVEAEVGEVKRGLDMLTVDPDLLTKARAGCGKLAKEILPELAKISGPTLCLAALHGALHFVYVVGWLVMTSGEYMPSTYLTFLLVCSQLDILVGPLCLFLPARVSDAFADLLEILNELRIKPVKEGCSAEVDREVRLMRSFIKDANRGNGLGFKLLGTVVDKQMIISIVTKLVAASSVVVTLLRQVYKAGQDEVEAEHLLAGDGPVYG
ncbi:unnamed protein product [Symbiodinium sp. CCMP2456]|nr:unnamed protein product [Symbiodinium sp. CCMP2456]